MVSSPSEPAASSRTGRRPQPPGYAPTSGPYKMGELVREGMIRVDDELKYDGKENTSCRVVVSLLPSGKGCSALPYSNLLSCR